MYLTDYEGKSLAEVRFPLGGIGAGNVSVAGNGALVDWEQSGTVNKYSVNGFSHFAIKAEDAGGLVDARALLCDESGPRTGGPQNSGVGTSRSSMMGLPHFKDGRARAGFPFYELSLSGSRFPGQVTLEAFSPFIPLQEDDSSLPAGFFTWTVVNDTDREMTYTLAFSLSNPFKQPGSYNEKQTLGGRPAIVVCAPEADRDRTEWGQMAAVLVSDLPASWQQSWYRGSWFDGLAVFWRDFTAPGPLKDRVYPREGADADVSSRTSGTATLAAAFTLAPGARQDVRFLLCWYYPWMENTWSPMGEAECQANAACGLPADNRWKKHYATRFAGLDDLTAHILPRWQELEAGSRAFAGAVAASTLPPAALDAASANLAILKSPTCLRLTDGSFYGWEGGGCCEGSCTHVWNYQYALPFLFPRLERSMRDLDFTWNMDEDGGMRFRLQLPAGRKYWRFAPCADGQFGGVVKLYRDYLICGDRAWLRRWWPVALKNLRYAWSPHNPHRWDADRDGVLEGRQHHTLDMELFGPNSWLTGLYLAALQAGALIAGILGEGDIEGELTDLFHKGRAWVDEHLFNGEYFYQKLDLEDKSVLDPYTDKSLFGYGVVDAYWNDEAGELKYQIGEGCALDQVIGQWHAHLCGLPERIFDRDKTRSALSAIHKYNYLPSFRDHFNPCRLYCMNDEAGTLICAFPPGKRRPVIAAPYAEETMHGFEYQAAAHMVQEGLTAQGMDIVKAVRDRYDGTVRNPFNEFECGHNYARSMAAFALLPAFSGLRCDMDRGLLGFSPVTEGDFACLFSLDGGWGLLRRQDGAAQIEVLGGALTLHELWLPFLCGQPVTVTAGGQSESAAADGEGFIPLPRAVTVSRGQTLTIRPRA